MASLNPCFLFSSKLRSSKVESRYCTVGSGVSTGGARTDTIDSGATHLTRNNSNTNSKPVSNNSFANFDEDYVNTASVANVLDT